jgi:hypothetical protein
MQQIEHHHIEQESKGAPKNGNTRFRAGDVIITPLRLLKFIPLFGICLVLAILLVRAMLS